MYLKHFGLQEFPFGLTPDTSFFFSSDSSQQALNTLLVAARSGEGFIKIVGEVGTGKTLLCRQFLARVGTNFRTAYIPNPCIGPAGLLRDLVEELGICASPSVIPTEQHALLKLLNGHLLGLAAQGLRVLVCLDEVQAMPIETLEALRLLTNLETEKRKLLQVVIFGQPELEEKLAHPSIRQLRQRITFEHRLQPLSGPELASYLNHRMTVAGYQGPVPFSALTVLLLKWRTGGVPRLVNIAAHKALISAYGRGRARVDAVDMQRAIADTAWLRPGLARLAIGAAACAGFGLAAMNLARML